MLGYRAASWPLGSLQQACQAHGGAEFPRFRLLVLGNDPGLAEKLYELVEKRIMALS